MKLRTLFGLLAAAATSSLLLVGSTGVASAQATRTWVSGVGDDANPCSRTAPCKTFAGAISKTATVGEINCLDSAGFGGLTITKAITVRCVGVEGGVLVSGTNAIVVTVPNATDKVVLDGLDVEGLGTGLDGIKVTSRGKVYIRNTLVHNFTNAVNVSSTTGARVVVEDSQLINNAGAGLLVAGGGTANTGILVKSVVDNNATVGAQATAPSSLTLDGSAILGAAASVNSISGAVVTSFGNNAFSGTIPPLTTITLK